uniref:SH3 domain-containing protein n=1 Tax=Sphenodon punctatus TaxID=8508 RepID=A0A8D0L2H9_SPHPU
MQFSPQAVLPPLVPNSGGEQEEIYDDVEPISTGKELLLPLVSRPHAEGEDADLAPAKPALLPPVLREFWPSELKGKNEKSLKQCKKEEKEDKEFRKKFKFEGEIHVLTRMMIDPNAFVKKGGSKNLPLKQGEILDIIQFTSHDRFLCRNYQRKYGYVPRAVLLPLDSDIYDDVGLYDEMINSA